VSLERSLTNWLHSENLADAAGPVKDKVSRASSSPTMHLLRKGLGKAGEALQKGRRPVLPAQAYAKLDSFTPGLKINFRFTISI